MGGDEPKDEPAARARQRLPGLAELRRLDPSFTEDARAQLVAAAEAVDGWIAAHPEGWDALLADPTGFLRQLVDEGILDVQVDQLLEVLAAREVATTPDAAQRGD